MHVTHKKVNRLLELYQEISLLNSINSLLDWDLNVNLPAHASQTRAQQTAYITEKVTEMWLKPELLDLVDELYNDTTLTLVEKAVVRNANHALKYYRKIPKKLIVEFSHLTSVAFMSWYKARKDNNYHEFLPHLKKIVHYSQLFAQHLEYKENPYDALLELYEPELTTQQCQVYFDEIKPTLTHLIKKITNSKEYIDNFEVIGEKAQFNITEQRKMCDFILRKIGYDFNAGRLDVSPHPFTITLGTHDTRVTTSFKETDFKESFMSTIHEGGHALYEQGINPKYNTTPLENGVSLGIHESQSRFWENQIGRHPKFIEYLIPHLKKAYPSLAAVDTRTFILLFNHVKPGFIRIEADEVTYNMHIILRFELERDLITGKLSADELPHVWNEKMKQYLGIKPPTNRQGVLQDVHWSYGSFGYFPTYTLGNLYAGQLRAKMLHVTHYEDKLIDGNVDAPLAWLKTHIHKYGSLYLPEELIKKATGHKLSTKYYLDYISEKYSKLYGI